MSSPLQQPIPCRMHGNVPGYVEGCRNVEADQVQTGSGILSSRVQQRPRFAGPSKLAPDERSNWPSMEDTLQSFYPYKKDNYR